MTELCCSFQIFFPKNEDVLMRYRWVRKQDGKNCHVYQIDKKSVYCLMCTPVQKLANIHINRPLLASQYTAWRASIYLFFERATSTWVKINNGDHKNENAWYHQTPRLKENLLQWRILPDVLVQHKITSRSAPHILMAFDIQETEDSTWREIQFL